MKVNIFKKLIREVIREELDYKFSVLEKKIDEALVSNNTNSIINISAIKDFFEKIFFLRIYNQTRKKKLKKTSHFTSTFDT